VFHFRVTTWEGVAVATRARSVLLLIPLLLPLASPAAAVTIDWVAVGNPGNAADTTGYGAVGTSYFISKYEVTNAQYAEFLNAVADTDANGLHAGDITRSGVSGSYTYTAVAGFENRPVRFVSYYDTLRFANWLHNGQPNTGSQTAATTEAGAYTFTGPNTVGARNGGATFFLPTENEWYKAAYYDAISTSYFDYPASSDTPTTCATPTATPNRAHCNNNNQPFNVGSYPGSPSPYGTFDQGGNVAEWMDALATGSNRVIRGGSLLSNNSQLAATFRGEAPPTFQEYYVGFRVGSTVPEPGTGLLLMTGLAGLALRRRRS
jgi:formylglycine-generating enzyme required for sulfatase activity